MKLMRQEEFSYRLRNRLQKTTNKSLQSLSAKDINQILYFLWDEISIQIKNGYRVVFDGWISIFTKPIQRSTYKSKIENTRQMTYGHRIRFKALEQFKKQAEVPLTKEQYEALQIEKTKK